MKHLIAAGAVGVALLALAAPAQAGPSTDALTACIVRSATPVDRQVLVSWVFSAMAADPKVRGMATITPAQQDEISRKTVTVMERLILKDCRAQTIAALRIDGPSSIEIAFGKLGEIAMGDIMDSPEAQGVMGGLKSQMDVPAWEALGREVGGR